MMRAPSSININDSDKSIQFEVDENSSVSQPERLNAAFVVLVKNEELTEWISSMKDLESKFNSKFNYPYVFLNDKNFTQEFKETVKQYTSADTRFGLVPKQHWSIPQWIDQTKMRNIWDGLYYPHGKSESYRHMCRFQSGFFYKHSLVKDLDYYWRVEPGIKFPCDIKYDPFKFMKDNNKKYGFTIPISELMLTLPTLMPTIDKWIAEKNLNDIMPSDNGEKFVRNVYGGGYNACQFWNNFEIASTSIWKSALYEDYFNHLDKAGGFFYERWGDAPIHTIYVSLFLKLSEIHFFEDIGYKHLWVTHCPKGSLHAKNNCECDKSTSHDWSIGSCMSQFLKARNNISHNFLMEAIQLPI